MTTSPRIAVIQNCSGTKIKFDIFSGFLFELSELDSLPLEFDTKLFHSLVDYATVYHDGRMVFTFRNGTEIETKI